MTTDPAFPLVHPRPARGWVNDPNGLCRVDGRYHVFFQFNPSSTVHEAIHWGHLSSPDLLTWREEPIALSPRPGGPDAHGCWSGVVVVDDGVPTAVYSGVLDGLGRSSVVLARSDSAMRAWEQDAEAVTGMPDDPRVAVVRDPFVLEVAGGRFAVQGAGLADGRAAVLLHRCDDLRRWEYQGVLLASDHPVAAEHAAASVWECPQLVAVDGSWVLLVSRWVGGEGLSALGPVAAVVGDLTPDGDSLAFEPVSGGPVDTGRAFYAPQALALEGRVLLVGWSFEDGRSVADAEAAGWAGLLTLPRELRVEAGQLRSAPARELVALRRAVVHRGDGPVSTRLRAFEVVVDAAPGKATLALDLVDGGDARPVLRLELPPGAGARVLVDGSVVEAFVDGSPPWTGRAYPSSSSEWRVAGAGRRVTVHELGPPP